MLLREPPSAVALFERGVRAADAGRDDLLDWLDAPEHAFAP